MRARGGRPMCPNFAGATRFIPIEINGKSGARISSSPLGRLGWNITGADRKNGSERVMDAAQADSVSQIRKQIRFALGNFSGDFDSPRAMRWRTSKLEELEPLDGSHRTSRAGEKKAASGMRNYEFHRVYHAIPITAGVDLSWPSIRRAEGSIGFPRRRLENKVHAAPEQNPAVWKIRAARWSPRPAPILVFTAEEIWKVFAKRREITGQQRAL